MFTGTKQFLLAVFIVAVAAVASSASAATINVAAGQSIQAGINSAAVGDVVQVGAGTFVGGINVNKQIVVAGTVDASGKWLTVLKPATDGTGIGVTIGADGCAVVGLEVNGFQHGIAYASPGSSSGYKNNVTVRGNHVLRAQFSLWTGGSGWVVENNDFEAPRWWDGQGDCDYTRMFGKGHVFRGNRTHGANFSDTSLAPSSGSDYAHVDGIQFYGSNDDVLQDCTIENNDFEDCHQGLFLCDEKYVGQIARLTVRNNRFISRKYTPAPGSSNYNGYASWGICIGKNFGATAIVLENNTIVDYLNAVGLRGRVDGAMRKNVLRNSGQGTAYDLSCATPGSVVNTNLLWGFAATGQQGWNGGDTYKDPVLDGAYRVTLAGYTGYGWQGVSAPAPAPSPTPTPEPAPTPEPVEDGTVLLPGQEAEVQQMIDAAVGPLVAQVKALQGWVDAFKKSYPRGDRQFRDRNGGWRYAPSN